MTEIEKRTIKVPIMPEWHLKVEETRKIGLNGILLFSTPFGDILVKVMSFEEIMQTNGRCVFEILGKTQLLKMGFSESYVQVNESFIDKTLKEQKKKRYVVEESSGEPSEESEPDRLKRIREESEKFMEDAKKKNAEKEININFYSEKPKTERIQPLENAEEISSEDVETAREIIDTGFERLQEKYPQLPEEYRPKNLKGLEKLKEMLEYESKNSRKPPAGVIPLPQSYYEQFERDRTQETSDLIAYQGSVKDLSFDSKEQMYEVLKRRSKLGDTESAEYLDKLLGMEFRQSRKKTEEYELQGGVSMMTGKEKPKWKKRD